MWYTFFVWFYRGFLGRPGSVRPGLPNLTFKRMNLEDAVN